MTTEAFRKFALAFPGTVENPHFDRMAYKVEKRRIFATLHEVSNSANIKLPLRDQGVFSTFGNGAIYPVPNKWGLQGWTTFELHRIPDELLRDALETAYNDVFTARPGK